MSYMVGTSLALIRNMFKEPLSQLLRECERATQHCQRTDIFSDDTEREILFAAQMRLKFAEYLAERRLEKISAGG
jgi:hypothetical protein